MLKSIHKNIISVLPIYSRFLYLMQPTRCFREQARTQDTEFASIYSPASVYPSPVVWPRMAIFIWYFCVSCSLSIYALIEVLLIRLERSFCLYCTILASYQLIFFETAVIYCFTVPSTSEILFESVTVIKYRFFLL